MRWRYLLPGNQSHFSPFLGEHYDQHLPEEIGHPLSSNSRVLTGASFECTPCERHLVVPSHHISVLRVELASPRVAKFHTCCFFHIPCRDTESGDLVVPALHLVIITSPQPVASAGPAEEDEVRYKQYLFNTADSAWQRKKIESGKDFHIFGTMAYRMPGTYFFCGVVIANQ